MFIRACLPFLDEMLPFPGVPVSIRSAVAEVKERYSELYFWAGFALVE